MSGERWRVPGTDLELSPIGLGAWALGGREYGPVDDAESIATIRSARDAGIDWIDTAPIYGRGHADDVIARALAAMAPADRPVILTKVGARLDPATGHATSDLSPEHLRADCDASLARLGCERIDLLQVHWPCERGTPLADTIGALDALRAAGKVRAWGLCNYSEAGLGAALEVAPVATLQTPLSMLRRDAERTLLPLARSRDVAVLAYETLCRGLLTAKFDAIPRFAEHDVRATDPRFWGARYLRNRDAGRALARAGERIGATPEAIAIGWVLTRPGVTAAVVGAKTPEQLRRNARAVTLAREPRLWTALAKLVDGFGVSDGR